MSLQSMSSGRIESGSGLGMGSISSNESGFVSGSGFGITTEVDSFSSKPKGSIHTRLNYVVVGDLGIGAFFLYNFQIIYT